MTAYLLDTNIISNVTKPTPSASLLEWLAAQADEDLFITSLTVGEIRRGVLAKPAGRKRDQLEAWFAGPEGPQALFAGRMLPFEKKPPWYGHASCRKAAPPAEREARST